MNESNPEIHPDGPHWDALCAFVVAEIAALRAHALCFRALAAVVGQTPPPGAPGQAPLALPAHLMEVTVATCLAIADGTDAETAKVEGALRRDDRTEIGHMAAACVEGYLRALSHRPEGKARGL